MNRIMVGLPCYNEEQNIGKLIDAWKTEEQILNETGYALDIVPVDDKSKDRTKEVILEKGEEYENVTLIAHEVNKNLGGGMNTIVNHFLAHYGEGDLLVVMDGDNSHSPVYIHNMLKKLREGYDCVIASRYREGSKVYGVPQIRILFSFFARFYYTIVLHIKNVRDYTCGYRVYTYDALKKAKDVYGEELITNSSFACMMELLYKIYRCGAVISEVPFVLHYDWKEGESKINIFTTIKDSLTTAIRIKRESKR